MAVASPRTRLDVDERRAQLLESGRELFNNRPYEEISIDDIADAAGISKGLLYHYFKGKRRFYVETVRAAADDMRARTEPDPNLPALERLETSLDAYIDYVAESGAGYSTLIRSGVGTDPELDHIIDEMRQVVIDRVLNGIGLPNPSPMILVALRGWVGFIEGVSVAWIECRRDVDRATLRQLFVNALQAALQTCVDRDPELGGIVDIE